MNVEPFYRQLSKRASVVFVALLFSGCSLLAILIPPFQSPDEFEHITRAYLLGRGDIVLGAPAGQPTGGQIDTGLIRYMESFAGLPFHPDKKLTRSGVEATKQIEWTGELAFRPALGMAYYFPGIYALHALGLKTGETLNLSVDTSYRMTRTILLIACCVILYYAFLLYQPPLLVLGLLVMPMTLFQFSSASLDGIATALGIFVISAFFSLIGSQNKSKNLLFVLLIGAWLLIASSRLQLFPMILLPLIAGLVLRRHWYVISACVAALSVIAWQILMMRTVVDGRVALGASTGEIAAYYLQSPMNLVNVLVMTLSDEVQMRGYFSSFFGMLGWLDTPFAGKEYTYLFSLTMLIFLTTVAYRSLLRDKLIRVSLVTCAIGSLAIIFFAMLISWTPHPATVIEGVQGRYFLIPAIMLAYALCHTLREQRGARALVALSLTVILGLYSFINTGLLLLARYQFGS
jgi:uncharacterized membrane protein